MNSLSYSIVPIVLHQIVSAKKSSEFEDVLEDNLRYMLNLCGKESIVLDKVHHLPNNLISPKYLITFDDGFLSDYVIAFPLLQKFNALATFFIVTNRIGSPGYLSKSQIRELDSAGMSIGSHSVSHPNMIRLNSVDQINQLHDSRKCLEDILGKRIYQFSFPYGKFNKELIKLAMLSGYKWAWTSKHGVIGEVGNLLPRNSINGRMDKLAISNVLNPTPKTMLRWQIEDLGKEIVKLAFGDDLYRRIRNRLGSIVNK